MKEKIDLASAYEKFKKSFFPSAPVNNNTRVDGIFCELVLLDSHIASVVEKIIKKKKVNKVDFEYDFGFELLIKEAMIEEDDTNKELLGKYLIYMEELKKLLSYAEALH